MLQRSLLSRCCGITWGIHCSAYAHTQYPNTSVLSKNASEPDAFVDRLSFKKILCPCFQSSRATALPSKKTKPACILGQLREGAMVLHCGNLNLKLPTGYLVSTSRYATVGSALGATTSRPDFPRRRQSSSASTQRPRGRRLIFFHSGLNSQPRIYSVLAHSSSDILYGHTVPRDDS